MTSAQRNSFRMMVVGIVCLQAACLVAKGNGFSMIRGYAPDEYPLKDLVDFEYVEEPSVRTPVKRQKNQSGTCTCTCETRPVKDEPKPRPPATQYAETGSLLRTGTGMKPPSAARVLEKPYQQKTAAEVKETKPEVKVGHNGEGNNDLQSKIVKVDPWDFSDYVYMEPSKNDVLVEEPKKEEKPVQEEKPLKATAHPDTKTEQSAHPDTWGHNSRFPWKLLPNVICFRESCKSDKDCCMRYNLCDKSAKVCVDCWYGSTCTSERDCCQRFPYCQRTARKSTSPGFDQFNPGKCVNKLSP